MDEDTLANSRWYFCIHPNLRQFNIYGDDWGESPNFVEDELIRCLKTNVGLFVFSPKDMLIIEPRLSFLELDIGPTPKYVT